MEKVSAGSAGKPECETEMDKESGPQPIEVEKRFSIPRPREADKASFTRLRARLLSTGHKVVNKPYLNKSQQPKNVTNVSGPPPIIQLQKASAINSVRHMRERIIQAKKETGKSLPDIEFPTIQKVLPNISSRGSPTKSEFEERVTFVEIDRQGERDNETVITTSSRGIKRDVSAINEGVDPLEFIANLKHKAAKSAQAPGETADNFEFVYLDFSNDSQYNPYDLKIVPHSAIKSNNFFTLSSSGITKTTNGISEFTPLSKWEREHQLYQGLIKIPLIRKFRCWKAFSVWRKNVRAKKMKHCANRLTKNLFILDDTLSNAIMDVRHLCQDFGKNRLYQVSEEGKYTLSDFDAAQKEQASEISEKLDDILEKVRDIVYNACVASLQEAGFAISYEQDADLSYTDQAAKRAKCARLTNYVRMCDYLLFSALQKIIINTLEDLTNYFKTTPLNDWTRIQEEEDAEEDSDKSKKNGSKTEAPAMSTPMFEIELVIEDEQIVTKPSVYEVHGQVEYTFNVFMETVLKLEKLWMDEKFEDFTSPNINPNLEFESEISEGPDLAETFDQDDYFRHLQQTIEESIDHAFKDVANYTVLLEEHKEIYLSNKNVLQENSIRSAENDLEFFSESLEKYGNQYEVIAGMIETKQIQFLWVSSLELKNNFLPYPSKCLEEVRTYLPILGAERNRALIFAINEYLGHLRAQPVSVEEFVELLAHLAEVKQKLPEIEQESSDIHVIYEMMDKNKIDPAPEDFAVYRTLSPAMTSLFDAISFIDEKKEENTGLFSLQLERNITNMNENVMEIKGKLAEPFILSGETSSEEAEAYLHEIDESVKHLSYLGQNYNSHQKELGMEVQKHEELEMVQEELRLKKLLWTSQNTWQECVDQWTAQSFDTMDADEINTTIAKYTKTIFQLEKGLPPNTVIPKLKMKVEEFKLGFPCIVDLRNPALKSRHWQQIHELIGQELVRDETFTLGTLLDLNIFSKREEIEEISVQATNEATLEEMLKKVENNWRELDYQLLPYKDTKDMFILGGIDEIMEKLEDSQVTISTIRGSRFQGPIKPQVDEWYRLLQLFSETLDEWIQCQRNWMYLETIFSAPDIQRQLPNEAKMFQQVDKSFKEVMRTTNSRPNAMKATTGPGLLSAFQQNNSLLEKVEKCLEEFLESKRLMFPRFYFLSNDELLEILAQTKNPHAIQPHLRKCFDAIQSIEFSTEPKSIDILAMLSPEGEKVNLGKNVKARGNVEVWLGSVEESMYSSVRRAIKTALFDFENTPRAKWLMNHPGQAILTVGQINWAKGMTEAFLSDDSLKAVQVFYDKSVEDLNELADLVGGKRTPLQRGVLGALITIDVHARDMVAIMIKQECNSIEDFEWSKQLRYYWDNEEDGCILRMSDARLGYGYEYLGCSPRLVITPLTDRCYLTLTGAMSLNLGGAPAGPAGTGKTETVKDLAKALARQCVVFNCSDQLDYKMMGKFFAGLAQSGAWACFDEFNRIDIEVLSVVAQQVLTIKRAMDANVTKFMYEGREIRLIPTCSSFITMNPGYAGRTELPDNLKALYRPMAMMIPDYRLIAEIMLFSEGFRNALPLSKKLVNLYKLCSEQLSQQDHYDFGMRAVKSVLVMAGSIKRANPSQKEDLILIRSLRDGNLPKFLAQDVPLFQAILQDLFPGVEMPVQDYGNLQKAIESSLKDKGLQVVHNLVAKVIQLFETMNVRHGVMLVGPSGSGKTVNYEVLAGALTKLRNEMKIDDADYQPTHTHVMNPKSITMGELYGEINLITNEWKDGLLSSIVRMCANEQTPDFKWVVCDGPVDAIWIENMNTVLDDNKTLCLSNGERIRLNPTMHMMFEVQDLAVASPATVSRCGMVYMDPADLGWRPYVLTWLDGLPHWVADAQKLYYLNLFDEYVDKGLAFLREFCRENVKSSDFNLVCTLCHLSESLLTTEKGIAALAADELQVVLQHIFVFAYTWSLGGNLIEETRDSFDEFERELFEGMVGIRLPPSGLLIDYFVQTELKTFVSWEQVIPKFKYDPSTPYFDVIVPTIDTVRFSFLLEKFLTVGRPVMFNGETGTGKSVITVDILSKMRDNDFVPIFMNFSAQTSSERTQEMIELKLEKKRKNILGAPVGKKLILFVDDVNMPKVEEYGAQPPVELLRQYLDFKGFYDREKLYWKSIEDMTCMCACAPPGGGRSAVTPRFVRHFSLLSIPAPSPQTLQLIFQAILSGFLEPFSEEVRSLAQKTVESCCQIYDRMSEELLPTPAKSHYTFNLRDLSKAFQGILQSHQDQIRNKSSFVRLFCHECSRVFHDRLIDIDDKRYFNNLLSEIVNRNLGQSISGEDFEQNPIIFCDFMSRGEEKPYIEVTDMTKIKTALNDFLDEYNLSSSNTMKLVFFADAIEHISRISRIIRQPRGCALLVGVGGTGKQSLTRLACHMSEYKCFQIELSKGYGVNEFRDDLKKLYQTAGVEGLNTTFLFTDTQILDEGFLEDINNILNSGEVPNLFDMDEREKMLSDLSIKVKNIPELANNRDALGRYFISRVRDNLHIVLCMSPVGDAFRERCRMFPSLVNCCTIDWLSSWPTEALLSVSQNFLESLDLGKPENNAKLAQMCVDIHSSVNDIAEKFWEELRRKYYTTPTSYLELINFYISMLAEKREEMSGARDKLKNGLQKLMETNELVADMKVELTSLEPELKEKAAATEVLMGQLEKDQAAADEVKKVVSEEESVAKAQAEETQAIAADAQKDLDEALPALASAEEALQNLDKSSISELKVFNNPPPLVALVMEAVCLLFKVKPDWASAKTVLNDPQLLKKMIEFDKDKIPESTIKKLEKYVQNPDFTPENVAKVSSACKSMCMWIHAIVLYSHVNKTVAPKRARLEEAETSLAATMAKLEAKQSELSKVEATLAKLEADFQASINEKKSLQDKMQQTSNRLVMASKLTTALADEQVRWTENVAIFEEQIKDLIGSTLIASACIAYYGAFTVTYRQELVQTWVENCKTLEIRVADNVDLISVCGDPVLIREWNIFGLPADNLSTENGILVNRGRRWPLMIDPQGQANKWIRQMEEPNQLKVIKLTDQNYLRTLENAIRMGTPVLLEEVGETLDPSLEPILLRQVYKQGGRMLIRLGDSDIDYDKNFKFYMTSKLSNPHYLPEICVKVTIINFTVTPKGLEDQLLADVVSQERPDLEEQRNKLVTSIAADKKELKDIENKILKLLFESKGNILDDDELVNTLQQSKVTSKAISARLIEAEETEKNISTAREIYRPVSIRGSILCFVVSDLALIDPMYQFSLEYFSSLFNQTIEQTDPCRDIDERIKTLIANITSAIYRNISRGLFEEHKLMYSFMNCVQIMRNRNEISTDEWNFFLRGSSIVGKEVPLRPNVTWISEPDWEQIFAASLTIPPLENLVTHIQNNTSQWELLGTVDEPQSELLPSQWEDDLTCFQKLMVKKLLRKEKTTYCVTNFVIENLGRSFVESGKFDLNAVYEDMVNTAPLIFVLSTGSDPTDALLRCATEKGYDDKLHIISLGQGQGPIAESLISKGTKEGHWVFLQNCHLATSWMLSLEVIVKDFKSKNAKVHPDFRLWLSSMPSKTFPVSVLQNGLKVVTEPPKGLRANLIRTFGDLTKEEFETHAKGDQFKRLLCGLFFFHAAIQERKKYGPLGWNIKYEFNESDRMVSMQMLRKFLWEQPEVPWDALNFLTAEITYGGRVTDDWDRRCMKNIVKKFYTPEALEGEYKFSVSGKYHNLKNGSLEQYQQYIEQLPLSEGPEVFGLHDNANITYENQETNKLISTILSVQPRVVSGGGGKTSEEVVSELAASILEQWPKNLDVREASESLWATDEKGRMNSLSTVLKQESTRFNKLLTLCKTSLESLIKAIKGLVVMSAELERVFISLLNNHVPTQWANAAYPSLKPLAPWVKDLIQRVDTLYEWIQNGQPKAFWLPGFFFPQGFLTGSLQNYARKYNIPIDSLSFCYEVLSVDMSEIENVPAPDDGVLVHGLFLEGAVWDRSRGALKEANAGELHSPMPLILFKPAQNYTPEHGLYDCPLYKTSIRAGTLSTTGHSTNFVLVVYLNSLQQSQHWILRGTALLCQLDN
eukprot:Nk52_evm35s2579 gene=Nk52_evmTU35s2579